jgi:hypothetical protein
MALPPLQFQVESRFLRKTIESHIIYGNAKIPAAISAAA